MIKDVEKLFDDMFINYISPKKYENFDNDGWQFFDTFRGMIEKIPTKQFIEKLLDDGYEVKTGWTSTSIRGLRTYHVLRKK